MTAWLLLAALAAGVAGDAAPRRSTGKGCLWLNGEPDFYKLEWDMREDTIELTMTGKTEGWVGLGISLDGTMTSKRHVSDMMIGWVDDTSADCANGCVRDYASETYERPELDEERGGRQDLTLVHSSEKNGKTSIGFSRALNTHQIGTDRSFKNDNTTMHIIWAMGPTDPLHPTTEDGVHYGIGHRFAKHFTKGVFDVNFLEETSCTHDPPKALVTNEYTAPDGTYSMEWNLSPDRKTLEVTMTALTVGWIGYGFNVDPEPLMGGSDMVVGWVTGDGDAYLFDMYAPGYQMPVLDTQRKTSEGNVRLVQAEQDNGVTRMTFSRPVDTNDPYSDVIIPTKDMTALWAYGFEDGTIERDRLGEVSAVNFNKHANKGMIKTNFFRSTAVNEHFPVSNTVRTHAVLMFLAWAVLVPTGIWLARYYKSDTWYFGLGGQKWFSQHVLIQSLAVAFMCVAVAVVVYARRSDIHFDETHERVGMVIFFLGLVQPIIGYLADKWWNPNRVEAPVWPDRIHWWLGRAALALAVINIGLGMELYHVDLVWVIFYSLGVTLVGLYWIYREIVQLRKGAEYHLAPGTSAKPQHSSTPKWLLIILGLVATLAAFFAMHRAYYEKDIYATEAPPDLLGQDSDVLCDDCFEIDANYDNYHVSTRDTSHICLGFQLDVSRTYHIIEMSHIKSNEEVLHHMVMYRTEKFWSEPFECITMPSGSSIMYAWAPGKERVAKTPPRAGFRAGRGTDTENVLIQMHYINPTNDENQYDSSGVHMVATTRLREYDAAVIYVGVMNNLIRLPPKKYSEVAGECNTDMQSEGYKTIFAHKFQQSGYPQLNIFAYGLHGHDHARKIRVEHWRKGRRLPRIGEDIGFDWENQQLVSADVEWKLGDRLVTHCGYENTEDHFVIGGGFTGQEMCQAFIGFYPKIQGAMSCVPPMAFDTAWMWGDWTPDPEDTW